MKIATWNINGMRARLDFVLHWLRARQPDIVGLQELKLTEDQFPYDALSELGYHAVVVGQKAWNGVAVLSREPAELVHAGLPGQDELGARLVCVRVADMAFTTAYCPNGKSTSHPDFLRKLGWFDALIGQLGTLSEVAGASAGAVLCGDFNLCPTPLDSYNEDLLRGSIFHTDAERERYQRILDHGFVDLFRAAHPEERAFSWWDYRGGAFHKRQGLRIDFVLGTADIAARTERVEIDRTYRKKHDGLTASDHAPVIAELR
ncbi:exodeoxyribonuclease III [Haliangium ochraceum]|uniref:Exodeoxyribonuclease III Xth n=1 Tax=Haliangium ochraceum (strain DSM 14365 / JCM 11303 / SMP-2) TaxID=502025 RepID=D0LGA5_HALO1|nr:exodeoxyribonuclease III [Haliangium ochraceum]ACY18130.1 exodeoxyribonuclease III Xth [Haliangium ochraceum DSM 14365]